MVEQLCFAVGDEPYSGAIIAESRGPTLDRELELTWKSLRIKAETIRENIVDFRIRSKQECLPGLELADLVVSPIGRHVIGKPDKADWRSIEPKILRRRDGEMDGYGLTVLP